MIELPHIQDRLEALFFPHKAEQTQKLKQSGCRLIHYTTAKVASLIFTNQEIWMQDTRTMNDYSEIDHGICCLERVLESPAGVRFCALIDKHANELHLQSVREIKQWLPEIRNGTHLFCASALSPLEDQNGRLSMWRAYGRETGVALVFRGEVMIDKRDVLKVYARPVQYLNAQGLTDYFERIVSEITSNEALLKSLSRSDLDELLYNLYYFSIVCTKHPGFAEENEWRVIAAPALYKSAHIMTSIEWIGRVPRKIAKLKLKDMRAEGLPGLTIPELLDRVIIGPCKHPNVIADSLCELMISADIQDASSRIVISDIPLRTS